jgi:hypothetical protein
MEYSCTGAAGMSVSSTEDLDRLDRILYTRPAGRNIISYAIEELERLRAELKCAKSFHDVVVKERDYERVRNSDLESEYNLLLARNNVLSEQLRKETNHE